MSVALSAPDIKRALTRISHEILEKNQGGSSLVLLGIPTRGAHLAHRIDDRTGIETGDVDMFDSCAEQLCLAGVVDLGIGHRVTPASWPGSRPRMRGFPVEGRAR